MAVKTLRVLRMLLAEETPLADDMASMELEYYEVPEIPLGSNPQETGELPDGEGQD